MRPSRLIPLVVLAALAIAGGAALATGGLTDGEDTGATIEGGADDGTALAALRASDGAAAAADLPQAPLETFDGDEVALSELSGQPMVVNFYASWCPPCVGEMRDAFGPVDRDRDDIAFLGVALRDDPEQALAVAEETGVDYALVQDHQGAVYQQLGLAAMPATVYLDPDGEIAGRHNGALTREQLEQHIATYLDQR